jgi:protein-L-isoaspartate(D-aspartate) O-methyltransferase
VESLKFSDLRDQMVSTQLLPRGIKDKRVIDAMKKVPRHVFVTEDLWYKAYDDMALQIGQGQTISQPYMVAIMTELLELQGTERVLEIGTGSGYQTAVLAELSSEVLSIERIEDLSATAEKKFIQLGYDNVLLIVGDGTLGWPEKAPFDRVLVTAGTPVVPDTLKGQIKEGGIIVAPVGNQYSQQLVKAKKINDRFIIEYHTPCVFVPLIGKYGWTEGDLQT